MEWGMVAEADNTSPLRLWFRQLRIHQWSKNLLLLVPLAAAHSIDDAALWGQVLAGALMLSLVASGTYVLNDFLDLKGDRQVPGKRDRPLASGRLAQGPVAVAGVVVFVAGIAGAWLLDATFCCLLLGYTVTTVLYSILLKRLALVDVLVLSGLYLWRLVMGGELAGVPLSPWFLGFAQFFFVSIALAKRYAELKASEAAGTDNHIRRPYRFVDLPVILALGTGSALISVLILALYINSDQSQALYARPGYLWLMCPVMLYWQGRLWVKANRGELCMDPVLFALRDKASYVVLAFLLAIALLASVFNG